MLKVAYLHAGTDEVEILKGVNLYVREGEIHVIFGPNGSGKSTLFHVIIGSRKYTIKKGRIFFKGEDVTELGINERSMLGIGIAFQKPPTVKGLRLIDLVRLLLSKYKRVSEDEVLKFSEMLGVEHLLEREVNRGFSGGELKKGELIQLFAQDPDLIMLDEPDSGVDMESVEVIGRAIEIMLRRKDGRSAIIVTHTGEILDHLNADVAHMMIDGRIVCMGEPDEILDSIRRWGYSGCLERCMRGETLGNKGGDKKG